MCQVLILIKIGIKHGHVLRELLGEMFCLRWLVFEQEEGHILRLERWEMWVK